MQIIKKTFVLKIILFVFVFGVFGGGVVLAGTEEPITFDPPTKYTNIQELIAGVTSWLITFGLAIAVLMLIYGGFVFVTAAGNEEKVTNGRRILTWSVIGIAVLLLAKGIEFVIRSFLT